MQREDGSRIDGKVEKSDYKNAIRVQTVGAIKEMEQTYGGHGTPIRNVMKLNAFYLHEGITEYLTDKIFNSKYFDDLEINGKDKSVLNAERYIAYKPFYAITGMSEVVNNFLLSSCYFSDNFTQQDVNDIQQIITIITPLVNSIYEIDKLDKSDKDYIPNLVSEMNKFQDNMMQVATFFKFQFENKFDNLSDAKRKNFVSFYNYFLTPSIWNNYISVDGTNEKAKIIKEQLLNEIAREKANHQIIIPNVEK